MSEEHRTTRKRRTREHVLSDLSINHVERFVLRAGFTPQRQQFDYGIDLEVHTFNARGEQEPGLIYVQVKATDHIENFKRGGGFAVSVDERDLNGWIPQKHPVIFILYDGKGDRAYWLHIQGYFEGGVKDRSPNMVAYRTIHLKSRLNDKNMVKIAEIKRRLYSAQGSSEK